MKRDFSLFTGLLKTARVGDDLVLTGIASSTVRDRHGDTMTPKALESMLKTADGMTIYLNHSYNVPEDVAGSVRGAWIDKSAGDLHDLHLEIAINQENPRAVQAFNAIDKGTKLGLSIGAMIPEGGAKRTKSGAYVIDEVELLETSIVSIPANPRSWVEYARKSLMTKADVPEADEDEEEPVDDDPNVQHEPVVEGHYSVTDLSAAKSGDIIASEHFPSCNDQCDPATNTHYLVGDIPDGGTPVEQTQTDLGDVLAVLNSTDDLDIETKSKVTVWPSGKVSVETPEPASSQEATPQAEPEIEDAPDALSAALGEMSKDLEPDVVRLLGPTVMASLQTSNDLLGALVATVEKAVIRAVDAERERDEVVKAAATLTETVEAFITRVSATPRGRRAIAREIPQTVKTLEGIRDSGLYSDQFMDILSKGAPQ